LRQYEKNINISYFKAEIDYISIKSGYKTSVQVLYLIFIHMHTVFPRTKLQECHDIPNKSYKAQYHLCFALYLGILWTDMPAVSHYMLESCPRKCSSLFSLL